MFNFTTNNNFLFVYFLFTIFKSENNILLFLIKFFFYLSIALATSFKTYFFKFKFGKTF